MHKESNVLKVPYSISQSTLDRSNMLKILIRISSVVLAIFFFGNLFQGLYLFAFSNLINFLMLLTAGYYLKTRGNVDHAAVIVLLSFYATFITAIFDGGIENTSFIWVIIFPPVAIYLLGLKNGVLHIILMLGTILFFYILSYFANIKTHYTPLFFTIITFALVVETLVIILFEKTRLRYAALIEEQKENLKAIFDSQSNIAFLTDSNRLQDANRAFFDFFGYHDLTAFHYDHDCICEYFEPVEDDPLYLNQPMWLQTVLTNPMTAYKVKIKENYFSINIQKVDFPGKEEYVVVLSDISPLIDYQKRLENEVAKAVEKIEQQNAHLLEQSKKALLGELVNFISHQLKQPLTAISATVQGTNEAFLHNELDEETMQQNKEVVMRNINFMSHSIDSLKNFYRPNKEKEPFSPAQSIQKLLFLIQKSLKPHDIDISLHQPDEKLFIQSYENEFQQVILNLITNAKDALIQNNIPNPLVDITIRETQGAIGISIADNAGGIPEEHLPRIFENFFSTKGKLGTGIGLYMSKLIIEESMDGKLDVKNSSDGAVFTIELPLKKNLG